MQYLIFLMLLCCPHFHAVNFVLTKGFLVILFVFFLSFKCGITCLPCNSLGRYMGKVFKRLFRLSCFRMTVIWHGNEWSEPNFMGNCSNVTLYLYVWPIPNIGVLFHKHLESYEMYTVIQVSDDPALCNNNVSQ